MWQPSASFDLLKQKSQYLKSIREFFYQRNIVEYDVPLLGKHTVTDPYLDSINLTCNTRNLYLQTSPEYYMKRALAAGCGDIFYLGKAFREDDVGCNHNPEFTILEWYRRGFNDTDLAQELVNLVSGLFSELKAHWHSYSELFIKYCQIDPRVSDVHTLKVYAKKNFDITWDDENKSTWLDFLFTHEIEPKLINGLHVVSDYMVEQSALARIALDNDGFFVAKRFEVFLNGIELANGYWELKDSQEQLKRFKNNQNQREKQSKAKIDIDPYFMAAIDQGLPDCAGVAMGLDRLFMCLFNKKNIKDVNSFGFSNNQ